MPDGVLQWIDRTAGEARIVRGGRIFPALTAEVEPTARRPGARVHFDIRRRQGVETAVDVRLRPGSRVSHHQRHFGTLSGARRADTKGSAPFAHPHPELGLSLASHPLEVARAWARCMEIGDLSAALSLYAPEAVVHVGDETLTGRPRLQAYLEASPVLGIGRDAEVRGGEGVILVRWESADPEAVDIEARCRLDHGQIVEQWVGEVGLGTTTVSIEGVPQGLPVNLVAIGEVDEDALTYAKDRIAGLAHLVDEPILFARVKLTVEADPARPRPAIAQGALDVNGDLVRAHVAAHEMREAIDLLERRLRDKLEHRAEHRESWRKGEAVPEPGEWRHGQLPTARAEYFDRPVEERELVRHKAFAIDELTPEEAVFDMEQLGYDFYLFADLASGEDSLVERLPDGSYRLASLQGGALPGVSALPVGAAEVPAPALTLDEALERLNAGGERFVFFANAASRRGNVVYRRYDGHYGLITPAEPTPAS